MIDSSADISRAGGPAAPGLRGRVLPSLLVLLAVSLLGFPAAAAAAAAAGASDRALKATLAARSHEIAVDAHSLRLSAVRRHPRRLVYSARRFRAAALRAEHALSAQQPSSARGRRAKKLAVRAFAEYATVGRQWALGGQARLRHRIPAAGRHARLAAIHARRGSLLLIRAGRLLG